MSLSMMEVYPDFASTFAKQEEGIEEDFFSGCVSVGQQSSWAACFDIFDEEEQQRSNAGSTPGFDEDFGWDHVHQLGSSLCTELCPPEADHRFFEPLNVRPALSLIPECGSKRKTSESPDTESSRHATPLCTPHRPLWGAEVTVASPKPKKSKRKAATTTTTATATVVKSERTAETSVPVFRAVSQVIHVTAEKLAEIMRSVAPSPTNAYLQASPSAAPMPQSCDHSSVCCDDC